jgi:hypothetical protein
MIPVSLGGCRDEEADAFILFEDKPSDRRRELQISDFFNSALSKPAQQALLKLIGSLAVLKIDQRFRAGSFRRIEAICRLK